MSNSTMIDNWTLQEVEGLLSRGLGSRTVGEIALKVDKSAHSYDSVPEGVVQIDALLTLLSNLVCFDQLVVDKQFLHTWLKDGGHLAPLDNLGIVAAQDYASYGDRLATLREAIVDELCVTPTLRAEMSQLREARQKGDWDSNQHFSALVWGGAGMLARSHVADVPYFGHPARRRLLRETRFFPAKQSAAAAVTTFLDTERAKMFRFRGRHMAGTAAHLALPPIPVQVIEEADNLAELIPVAVNLRDRHQALREWLVNYQAAIDEEDERRQLRFEKTLQSVAQSMKVNYGAETSGSMGLSFSSAFFKLDVQQSLVDSVRNSVGVRSTLCSLLLTPRGHKALVKLLAMLGEEKSALGRRILQALQTRYGTESGEKGA